MKQLFKMWPEVLSGDICDQIIEHGNKMGLQQSMVGENKINLSVRSSRQVYIKPLNEEFKEVFGMCYEFFNQANADVFGFDIQYISGLQFTNYREQDHGHYDWHIDTFWNTDRAFHRKLSLSIQLSNSDDYEGGDLEFVSDSKQELPDAASLRKRGTIIVFPSIVSHRVTPITRGERYSLVAWIQGPKWR